MNTTTDPTKDEIYVLLVNARDTLISGFETTRLTYGDVIYVEVMKQLQKEHDFLLDELDKRINRRIMEMAVTQLS